MWATFPINAAFIVYNTVLPLYVLGIGGNVIDITNLFAVFNLVSIPAFVLWGVAIDRLHRRRFFFALSFSTCAVVFVAMFLLPNIALLFVLVSLLSVSIAASGPISGLLVMETAEKRYWYNLFGRLYFIANAGSAAGLLVGLVWPGSIPVGDLLLFCAGTSIASVVVTFLFVKDPAVSFEVASLVPAQSSRLARSYTSVAGRLQLVVTAPLRSLSRDGMRRIYRALRFGIAQARALLFFSSLFYMVAYAVINMSYVAFLSSRGISDSWVFGIIFSNMVLQLVGFALVSKLASRLSGTRLGLYSIVLTALTYLLVGISAIFLTGTTLLISNLIFFSLSGTGFALWTASTSLALYSDLGTHGQAAVISSYNALVGLGTVIGSVVSGLISFYVGYSTTFVLSSAILLVSLELLRRSFKFMVGARELDLTL